MSRTHIQQSQVSGSLSSDVSDSFVAADALTIAENRTLVADLNDLRRQVNRIIGEGSWSAALAGEQDLSEIYGALHVDGSGNAEFQFDLSVKGNTTLGDASTDTITFTAKAASDLAMDSHKVSGLLQASAAGDALAWGQDASVSDLIVTGGDFTVDASGNVSAAGTLGVTGVASFASAVTGSAGMQLAGDLDVNSSADFQGAVNLQSTLAVGGKADFADIVDVAGTLSASVIKIDGDAPAGALYLVGAAGEIAEEGNLVFSGGSLGITGALTASAGASVGGDLHVSGPALFDGGLTVSSGGASITGDRLEVTGSMGVTGAVDFDGTLNVDLVADFQSNVFMAADLGVSGSLTVQYDISAVDATLSGDLVAVSGSFSADLDVDGDLSAKKVSIDGDVAQRLYIVDADGSIKDESKLTFDGSLLAIDGDLKVGGNDIKASDDSIAISLSGADVTVKGDLTVEGNEIKSTTGTVMELSGLDAIFKANVQVDGDLRVKGATTYIDTQNMRVEDAFIYLATGSLGATDSGIVLHGGAGAGMDLVIGQDGGAGEVIFGKGNRAPDGDGAMDGIELVPAWMSSLKVGDHEGSLSGSFEAVAAGAQLSAEADLLLKANGETAISFIESGEYAAFNAQFPGSSLVAAIVAAGGNFKQDSFLPGVVAANAAIDFSTAVGSLRAASVADDAAKKLAMDVYLNGVRLAYTEDYVVHSATEIKLTMATMADDRLLIAIHNAA